MPIEHTYNPEEVIKKATSLQDNRDYLLLSVPNAEGEHINYILFYLVHLHSFTKESLELLLTKNNYELNNMIKYFNIESVKSIKNKIQLP